AAAPETDTGPVSTLRRLDRTPASPSNDTTTGLTVIVATSKPLAGVPVTTAFTGNAFEPSWLPTRIFTRTLEGSIRTGATASPLASTAMRSTDWWTETPDAAMRTRATAWGTCLTTDCETGPIASRAAMSGPRT